MICDALEHLDRYCGLHRNLDTAIDYLTAYHVAHDLYDLPWAAPRWTARTSSSM